MVFPSDPSVYQRVTIQLLVIGQADNILEKLGFGLQEIPVDHGLQNSDMQVVEHKFRIGQSAHILRVYEVQAIESTNNRMLERLSRDVTAILFIVPLSTLFEWFDVGWDGESRCHLLQFRILFCRICTLRTLDRLHIVLIFSEVDESAQKLTSGARVAE
jgi:hypothetical protein